MKKDSLHQPYQILLKEVMNECLRKEHGHLFFEMVYIISGSGKQYINKNCFNYQEGHLFLLTPEDTHYFQVEEPTQFFFIRFNDIYLRSAQMDKKDTQRLEFILKNASHIPGCIVKHVADRPVIKTLTEAIIRELPNRELFAKDLVEQYVNAMITIVARNISRKLPDHLRENSEEKAISIMQYIQQNVYDPSKLRAEFISKHFGVSKSYIGRYFKKHANESMQEYIMQYKFKLIENRLLYSDVRISEIAEEFGFSDKSHFHHLFKKYIGKNPSEFRKMQTHH